MANEEKERRGVSRGQLCQKEKLRAFLDSFFSFSSIPSSSMGLFAVLSRWLKRASNSSSSSAPKRPHLEILDSRLPDSFNEHAPSSLDASPLQAGLSRFSPSRHVDEKSETQQPSVLSPVPTAAAAAARAAASPSPSPQQQLGRRKPFAELSNKVKERQRKRKSESESRAIWLFVETVSPLLLFPSPISQNQNSPLPRPRGPSRSSQRQRQRRRRLQR